jgi:hypothetical protein
MFGSILAGSLGGKSTGGGSVNTGVLQLSGGGALTSSLQSVTDQSGNISPLQLSSLNVQINSPAGAGNERRLILNTVDSLSAKIFSFRTNELQRWALRVDGTESTGNAGSNFSLRRYNDAGVFILAAFTINRATGAIAVTPSNLTYSAGTNAINLIDLSYIINTTGGTNTITGININATHTSLTGSTNLPFRLQRAGISLVSVQIDNSGGYMGINQTPSVAYWLYGGGSSTGRILSTGGYAVGGAGRILTQNGLDWGNDDFAFTTGTGLLTVTTNRIRLNGTTSAFPALKRNGVTVEIRLADDSGYGNIDALRYFSNGVQGVSGSFLSNDGKTITVSNGIITAIV